METYMAYLAERLPEKDSLKRVRAEAEAFAQSHSAQACFQMGQTLYQSENFQIQEVGVFLLGYAACEYGEALAFLRNTVSRHPSWKVQEVLAMAFDNHCRRVGYENALPLIRAWLNSPCANVRRAASEGLRVWTSRPYFRDHPQTAIDLLAARRDDESVYVRKSIGNALRDISKKHGALVAAELETWDLTSKEVRQVYRLAGRLLQQTQ